MNITIIPMNTAHIPALTQMEKCCFSTPWSENSLWEELQNPLAHFLVAMVGGSTVGYIGTQEVAGECYITNIAVLPEQRRQGIAQALLASAIHGAQERSCEFITLEVRAGNTAAILLYEKNGFVTAGRRKEFYRHPDEDAFIMTRTFTEPAQR